MSVRKSSLVVTRGARRDVREILRYSVMIWDERQRDEYQATLNRVLGTILENPHIGKQRDDLRSGQRSFPVREHVIFYRVHGATIRIDRILHAKVDARTELGL